MNRFVFFLFYFLLVFVAKAQKYSFVTYSTEEGLPQSQVTAISQSEDGYLWVGTLGGLAKFNGKEFVNFSSNEGLWNNRVKTLSNFDDALWIGHDGGISRIMKNTIDAFGFVGEDQSRNVSQILKFNGKILVCTTEGGLFEFYKNQLIPIEFENQEIDRIRNAHVAGGKLHLATRSGILVTADLKTFEFLDAAGSGSFSDITGNDKYLVFSKFKELLFVLNRQSGVMKSYSFPGRKILGCYLDCQNQVWVNTGKGILRIKENGEQLTINNASGLPIQMISCFFQDSNSNMWIGSKGKGMFRFPGLSFQFFDESSGYQTDFFLNGFEKKNGSTYYGTYEKGVVRKSADGRIETIDIGESIVWASIADIDGKDWFGAQSSLVAIDENQEVQIFGRNEGAPGSKITSFCRIDAHSMYVGGNDGVARYSNGKFTRVGNEGVEYLGTVRDIELLDGVLYCCSNRGLFVLKNNNFQPVKGANQVIYNVEIDKNGGLWFGSEEGLFRLINGKIKRIKLLGDDPGSNFINFLNIRDNTIYIGTNNGLFVLEDLDTPHAYKRFGMGDGLPDLETNLNSGFFDSTGNFWFGTSSGLVCYHLDVSHLEASRPIANLKKILLNFEPFNYNTYSEGLNKDGLPKNLKLPYSKNNIIFELDGVSLVRHRGLKYQFRLDGLSNRWSPLSGVSSFTFTSLPAGDYVLKMRAVDIDGRMSDEVVFEFTILDAFYKTWWFLILCFFTGAVLIFFVFKTRLRRLNEKNEQEMAGFKSKLLTLEHQSINASMNRHFTFNALNSIQYFINTRDRLSANKYLTNFAKLIRKNLDTAATDQNMISLEDEIERLELYLSLESMRFKGRFIYEIKAENLELDSIKIPAMLIQPFIENSIIHGILPDESIDGRLLIDLSITNEVLQIKIEDNGIGVSHSLSEKGATIGDHRSQGMEITSKRIALIQKISNQGISMEGPKEVLNSDGSIKGTHVLIKIPLSNLEI